MSRYARITLALIAAWFALTFAAAALHLYNVAPGRPPLAFGLAALTPILAFAVWFAASPAFRAFARSLSPRTLTLLNSWRLAGFVFLVLATYGILPTLFAHSAGWGDIVIGATAPLAALLLATPSRRGSFILWQLLGMTDLVTALTLGALASILSPNGISTGPMTVLPLSLIPTFAVPLFFLFHVICIDQALRWPSPVTAQIPQPRRVPAL
jgi:hypothetical protein